MQLYLHRGAILTLISQEILAGQSIPFSSKILHWLVIVALITHNMHYQGSLENCSEIAQYLNGLLKYGDKMMPYWIDRRRHLTENMNLLFCLGCAPSVIIVPVGYVFGLHWFNPYEKTSLVGYWLLGKYDNLWGMIIKLIIFFFNFWFWTVGSCAVAFCIGGVQALFTISLRDSIRTFWNLESNFDKLSFYKRSVLYREVQVLSALQTEIQSGYPMTILIGVVPVLISAFLLVAIRSAENLTLVLFSLYMATLCVIAVLFVVGGQAGVWTESERMFKDLGRLLVQRRVTGTHITKEVKWKERFWKSCRNLIRVKFGINNFVEEETPLNCLNCAISITVQLLLLGT